MVYDKSKAADDAVAEPDPSKDPNAFISMKHSKTNAEYRATRLAYDSTYKDLGWVEVKNSASYNAVNAPGDVSPSS